MAMDSRGYTAFQVRGKGGFEFLRMPFGLRTAPATFIRAMEIILEGAPRLHPFIDDIKHGAPSFEEHLEDIKDLCSRCIAHKLRLSPKKFLAGFSSLRGLGYVVDAEGIHTDPEKVEVIHAILQPKDVTELRSFLGMVGYYSPLISNYSQLAGPLHGLTSKSKSVVTDWTEEHTDALAAQPCLAYPDSNKRYTITCDWQPGHMAAILSQPFTVVDQGEVERPIHFIAKKLSGYEAGWQATTGEQACVVWAVRKFHCYVFGVEFTLITDHKALVAMLHCQDTTGKLARWNVDRYGYDFLVQYRPGSLLTNADGLSRTDKELRANAPDPTQIGPATVSLARLMDSCLEGILLNIQTPGHYPSIMSLCKLDEPSSKDYEVVVAEESRGSSAIISTDASYITESVPDQELAELVGLHVRHDPPAGVDPDVWNNFILDFRPYESYTAARNITPTDYWQTVLAPPLWALLGEWSPGFAAQVATLVDFKDRLFLDALECVVGMERVDMLQTGSTDRWTESAMELLGQDPFFWKAQLEELNYLREERPALFGLLQQFCLIWEHCDDGGGDSFAHYPSVNMITASPSFSSEPPEEEDEDVVFVQASDIDPPQSARPEKSPIKPEAPPEDEFEEWRADLDHASLNGATLVGEEGESEPNLEDEQVVDLSIDLEENYVWLEDHPISTEAERAAHFNLGDRVMYATEEHLSALQAQPDAWQNPVFISAIRHNC